MVLSWFRPVVALFCCLCVAFSLAQSDPKEEKALLAKLEKSYSTAKTSHAKQASAKTKKTYIEATLAYADAVMYSKTLGPKVQYPKALNLYREVLKVDPKNKHAKDNKEMIEGIYKSMGRPIPK
jgi:hypothetical protein